MRAPFALRPTLMLCLGLPTSVGAQTDFPLPVIETGSSGPTAFASGDLNADGRPDVAVVHAASDKLAILIGRPGGAFESPWLFAAGDNPKSVAIADFDLDGRLDVATLNMTSLSSGTLTIVLLPASGPVTWTVPTGGNGETFAVGDLDGDGDPDVVTGNSTQKTLSVLPGLGPAGFGAPVTYPVGAAPRTLVLQDFDGDGALDVASVNSNPATLTLRHGDGQGGLLAATTLATAPFMSGLATADLDGDRDADLATASATDLLLLWNGSGSFASPQAVPLGMNASVALAGDLDGDDVIDLLLKAAPPGDDDRLQLAAGTGGGAFAPLVELLPLAPTQVLLDDADDDARTDVLGLLAGMGLCVFRGDGEGALVQPPPVTLAPAAAIFAVGDVNADGIDDLVSSSTVFIPFGAGPGIAWVQPGDGQGGWGAPQMQPFGAAVFLDLVDVTQDGHVDAVSIGAGLNQVRIVPGDGAGNFGPASTLIPLGSEQISRGTTADLDADGDGDIVLLTWVEWFMGSQFRNLVTLRNDGAGQWTKIVSNFDSATQFQPQNHLALGKCDGDAFADAVILDAPSGLLLFCQGSAGSGFGAAQVLMSVSAGDGDRPLALLDLDADGALDIVLASSSGVVVSRGHGDGSFDPKQTLGPGPADDPQLADLDGDGTNELVTDQSVDDIVWGYAATVWRADDEGVFTRQLYYSGPTSRSFLTDADLDGRPDLLTLQAADDFLGPLQGVGQLLRNHVLLAAWTDFGHGLAGSDGIPVLAGAGTLAAGSPGSLSLTHANPNHLAVLFISPVAQPTPFKGGMLVPVPPALSVALGTGPTGSITIPWNAWPSLPSGSDWFFQYGVVDSAGPAGASLSNALRALQP